MVCPDNVVVVESAETQSIGLLGIDTVGNAVMGSSAPPTEPPLLMVPPAVTFPPTVLPPPISTFPSVRTDGTVAPPEISIAGFEPPLEPSGPPEYDPALTKRSRCSPKIEKSQAVTGGSGGWAGAPAQMV
jgi:hypothetical protein